jgi:L-threonylcarbamoyladenylate synthase
VSTVYDCSQTDSRTAGLAAAKNALKAGRLVVLPTDTLYGLAADAFDSEAVTSLLRAKGRGRDMPVPVLVGSWNTIDGLVYSVRPQARDLIRAFWPGGLSLVVEQAPSLAWDLGDNVEEARDQLGGSASVYLDGGKAEHAVASTIVDLTGNSPRILRVGAVSAESIAEVLGTSPESLVEGVS